MFAKLPESLRRHLQLEFQVAGMFFQNTVKMLDKLSQLSFGMPPLSFGAAGMTDGLAESQEMVLRDVFLLQATFADCFQHPQCVARLLLLRPQRVIRSLIYAEIDLTPSLIGVLVHTTGETAPLAPVEISIG